ncbi:MAG: VWA domain-containing protein, partial [Chlorobiaceae bacterium]|nr:VWA domain-containing protein [Chlorobiaceae bacterium]
SDLYVKLFTEERERTLLLVVDGSASMLFGSRVRLKKELALELCAVLAFSAIQNNDKVGLLVFTDRVETYIAPRKGRQHVLVILEELFRINPQSRKTDVNAALAFIRYTLRRHAIVFLMTDLVDNNYEKGMKQLNNRHDFVLVHISDPLDKALPQSALLDLEEPETGLRLLVDAASRGTVERYRLEQARQLDELRHKLRRMRIDTIFLDTDRSFISDLNSFFRYRERKV